MSARAIEYAEESSSPRVVARPQRDRPRLRLLAPHRGRLARFPFVLGLLTILAIGMGMLVVVNTQIQTQAAQLSTLQRREQSLAHQQAQRQAEVDQQRSASTLQVRAYDLGMRPNPRPAFIVLPEGKILGTPTKVTGKELPDQRYLTWQQAQQKQEASRAAVARQRAEAERRRQAAADAKKKADAEAAKKKADAEAKKKADAEAKKKQQQKQPASTPTPTAGGR